MTEFNAEAEQKRMFEDAKKTILSSREFRSVADLAEILRIDSNKLEEQLIVWKDHGVIFSIPGGSEGELFPVFAFNRNRDLEIFGAIPEILEIFGDKLSRWGIASWFIADCSYLDDQSPKDLLEEDPEWVIEAARDEMDEISHG